MVVDCLFEKTDIVVEGEDSEQQDSDQENQSERQEPKRTQGVHDYKRLLKLHVAMQRYSQSSSDHMNPRGSIGDDSVSMAGEGRVRKPYS